MAVRLNRDDREAALAGLPGWSYDPASSALTRSFSFKSFTEAFAFMKRVAALAEAANHHPDWSNSYNTVTIGLSTHDAGGVSAKDVALAQAIDGVLT